MAVQPKLQQSEEREVALAYLCGVKRDIIGAKYNISGATIRNSIIGNRSHRWEDPLVELYRSTDSSQRSRNAIHLYLSLGGIDIPNKDLAITVGDPYELIRDQVIVPEIDRIVSITGLQALLDPCNGYEALFEAIFIGNERYAIVVAERFLVPKLEREYRKGGRFRLGDAVDEAAAAIIRQVKYGGAGISGEKVKLFEDVLTTLNEREMSVLRLRFGIPDYKKRKTLEETAREYQVSTERLRQIEAKAIRKLQHPSRSEPFQIFLSLPSEKEFKGYMAERANLEERARFRKELYVEIETEVLTKAAYDPYLQARIEEVRVSMQGNKTKIPIIDLEMSVRAETCLRAAGIRTVGEICDKTEAELLKTKNFGRKSLNEIKKFLVVWG